MGKFPILLVMICIAAACSDSGGTDGGGEGQAGSFAELLTFVPDTEENQALTTVVEVERAEEALGLESVDCDDAEGRLQRHIDLSVGARNGEPGLLFEVPSRWTQYMTTDDPIGEWNTAFGFAPCSTAAYLESGSLEGYRVTVGHDTVTEALGTDPVWSQVLVENETEVGDYFSWDALSDNSNGRSAARSLPNLALALVGGDDDGDDDTVLMSPGPPSMEAALSAGSGGASLAARPEVTDLLKTLETEEVYGVRLHVGPGPQLDAEDLDGPGVSPYRALGWGAGYADGEHFMVLVFDHAGADEAEANIDRFTAIATEQSSLRQPDVAWADVFTVTDSRVEGNQSVFRIGPPEGGNLGADPFLDALFGDGLLVAK